MFLNRPAPGQQRLPWLAIAISAIGHLVVLGAIAGLMAWSAANRPKVYVVNLIPAVAAVGTPSAPPRPAPPRPAPVASPPSREPAPDPPRREPVAREPVRLPPPTFSSSRRLPPRPAATLPRPGDKELPPRSLPRVASTTSTTTRPERIDRPSAPPPPPSAGQGQPTGSPTGVGALTVNATDFPYAWYLRQVQQKIQSEWQRQTLTQPPAQKPIVFFEIKRDGSIQVPTVDESSGNVAYDRAAVRSVLDASPFPPLPQDWQPQSLRVKVGFELTPSGG